MRKILFVDDEPNVLEGLQRMLFPLRKEWKMAFANSGQKALEILAQEEFDIIVSDMRMPGMDGAELLSIVRERFPRMVRFVLSGQSDRETIFRSVGAAHQFMSKPCDPKILKSTVDRAFALRDIFNSPTVSETVSRVGALPALPETYAKLVKKLQDTESSIADVGHIIESDVAMTAKVLQLVNSAFFGVRRQVNTAVQAVGLLGLDTIRSLVLVAGVFQTVSGKKMPQGFSMEALWHHSMMVGGYAQTIANEMGLGEGIKSECLTGGLLHDIGKLLLASGFRDEYGTAIKRLTQEKRELFSIEQELFGTTHAEVGAYLLGIWGLPDPIVESVAFHHKPGECQGSGFSALTAVHVANVFANSEKAKEEASPALSFDQNYLERAGVQELLSKWENACQQLNPKQEGDT